MNQIRSYFEQFVQLSDAEWQTFSSKLIQQRVPKKTVLLDADQIENYLSFVEQGIIRFFIPHEVKEVTFSFSFANEFFSAYDSFVTQTPATYRVETLTATTLWRMSYSNLQVIYQTTTAGNLIGRLAAEGLFIKKTSRELSLLSQTAEQRYLGLFTQQRHLLQLIPLKYLASYIGITPQALSRIRARIC